MKTNISTRKSLAVNVVAALFILFGCINAVAQIQPASNITGPLKAKPKGGNITITSRIAAAEANPNITYTLLSNSSGAYIVSKGALEYSSTTGTATQKIVVNPGSVNGRFVVRQVVTSAGRMAESSMSITVMDEPKAGVDYKPTK